MNVLSTGINEWESRMMEIKKDMVNILSKCDSITTKVAKDINLVYMEAQTNTGNWKPIMSTQNPQQMLGSVLKPVDPEFLSKQQDHLFPFMMPSGKIEFPGMDDIVNNELDPQIVKQYKMTPQQFTPQQCTHDKLRISNVGTIYSFDNDDECVLKDMNVCINIDIYIT